jgi:hypothetical protein
MVADVIVVEPGCVQITVTVPDEVSPERLERAIRAARLEDLGVTEISVFTVYLGEHRLEVKFEKDATGWMLIRRYDDQTMSREHIFPIPGHPAWRIYETEDEQAGRRSKQDSNDD